MQIQHFAENFYILDEGRVRTFLILGEGEALLIDTGFADSGVYAAVRGMTDAPVKVLLTHADGDHAGGLPDFGGGYLHPNDWPMVDGAIELHPLKEGDVFCCGGYRLEVLEIPGHTRGSVAFWEREKKLLISGDSVQSGGAIYMFGPQRDLEQYIRSQRKLCGIMDQLETVLPSHNNCPISPRWIRANLEDALALQAGRLKGVPHLVMPCSTYTGPEGSQFYF